MSQLQFPFREPSDCTKDLNFRERAWLQPLQIGEENVEIHDIVILPQDDETAAQFANRVKTEIARQGGLVDLIWYVTVKHL